MYRRMTATLAVLGMLGGAALASDHHLWLEDMEAQAAVRDHVTAQAMDPWTPPADFEVTVGATVPPAAPTHPFTEFQAFPEATAFEYVQIGDDILIVDTETREVVYILS